MSLSPVGRMVLGHLSVKYSQEAAYYKSFQIFRRCQWIPDDAGITGRYKGGF
jgi:hypothetical protein